MFIPGLSKIFQRLEFVWASSFPLATILSASLDPSEGPFSSILVFQHPSVSFHVNAQEGTHGVWPLRSDTAGTALDRSAGQRRVMESQSMARSLYLGPPVVPFYPFWGRVPLLE